MRYIIIGLIFALLGITFWIVVIAGIVCIVFIALLVKVKEFRQFCGIVLVCGFGIWLLAGVSGACQQMLAKMEEDRRTAVNQAEAENERADSEINSAIEKGKQAFQDGQYSESERAFERAISELRSRKDKSVRLGMAANNLAAVYHAKKKYSNAERLYQEAARCLGNPQDEAGRNQLRIVLKNHAAMLRLLKRFAEASSLEEVATKWEHS